MRGARSVLVTIVAIVASTPAEIGAQQLVITNVRRYPGPERSPIERATM